MKRTHSALILRNLASSIQHSMHQQTAKYPMKETVLSQARSSAQLPITQGHSSCTLTQ